MADTTTGASAPAIPFVTRHLLSLRDAQLRTLADHIAQEHSGLMQAETARDAQKPTLAALDELNTAADALGVDMSEGSASPAAFDTAIEAQAKRQGIESMRLKIANEVNQSPRPDGPGDVKLKAAVTTLEAMGYTHTGGEQWRPPLGPAPVFEEEQQRLAEALDGALKEDVNEQFAVLDRRDARRLLDYVKQGGRFAKPAPADREEKLRHRTAVATLAGLGYQYGGDGVWSTGADPAPAPGEEETDDDRLTVAPAEVRRAIEYPARAVTFTFTHDTIGGGFFHNELHTALMELADYQNRVEGIGTWGDRPAKPWPWTSSNGVRVEREAWLTYGLDLGAEQGEHFHYDTHIDALSAGLAPVVKVWAVGDSVLHPLVAGVCVVRQVNDDGTIFLQVPGASLNSSLLAKSTDVTAAPGEQQGELRYSFEQFLRVGRDQNPERTARGEMPWSFNFHGIHVTHERDDLYLLPQGSVTFHVTPQSEIHVKDGNVTVYALGQATPAPGPEPEPEPEPAKVVSAPVRPFPHLAGPFEGKLASETWMQRAERLAGHGWGMDRIIKSARKHGYTDGQA